MESKTDRESNQDCLEAKENATIKQGIKHIYRQTAETIRVST
jgi:hypothetical protein